MDEQSFLTFRLGAEIFAAHVDFVLKILQQKEGTTVPQSPEFMKGVINHHGEVLPLLDLKMKFGMGETIATENTCIVIFSLQHKDEQMSIGGLVEEVLSVEKVDPKLIVPYPGIGKKYKSDIISGVLNANESFIMVLNVPEVFRNLNTEVTTHEEPSSKSQAQQ